jgi:hypothetical protein
MEVALTLADYRSERLRSVFAVILGWVVPQDLTIGQSGGETGRLWLYVSDILLIITITILLQISLTQALISWV